MEKIIMAIEKYNNEKNICDNDIFFKLDDYIDKYVILCRLPGAIREEISIDYDDDNITIGTYVRESKESYGTGFYMAFTQSSYVNKQFYVPNSDIKKIKGNFDGLNLTIEIPKFNNKDMVDIENPNVDIIDVDNYMDI